MSPDEILTTMAIIFSEEMTEMKIKAYKNVLGDLTDEEWNIAFRSISNSKVQKKFPLPAEIRSAAQEMIFIEEDSVPDADAIDVTDSSGNSFFGRLMPGKVEDA